MADIRILEGGVQIPNLDRMMEIRRVDAAVSNLVFAFRDYATDLKMKNETSFSEKRLNYELNHLQEYLRSLKRFHLLNLEKQSKNMLNIT